MTLESSDHWVVTPKVIAEAERVGKLIRERNEKIRSSTPDCPQHTGVKGKFSHIAGFRPIYICPKGNHTFHLQN